MKYGTTIIFVFVFLIAMNAVPVSAQQACGAVSASNAVNTPINSPSTPIVSTPVYDPCAGNSSCGQCGNAPCYDPCAGNGTCGQCGNPDCNYDPPPVSRFDQQDERQAVSAPAEPAWQPTESFSNYTPVNEPEPQWVQWSCDCWCDGSCRNDGWYDYY
jgi:hypothetical protein